MWSLKEAAANTAKLFAVLLLAWGAGWGVVALADGTPPTYSPAATILTDPLTGAVTVGAPTGGFTGGRGSINIEKCFINGVACTGGGSGFANPTATIGTTAVNGSAGTAMRSDAAPKAAVSSATVFGYAKPDDSTIKATAGVYAAQPITVNGTTCTPGSSCSPGGGITGFDNPTATIGTAAVNGSATTAMRSDAAPAIPQASATTFGAVKSDNVTIIATAGVLGTAPMNINGVSCTNGGSCTTTGPLVPGTTPITGGTVGRFFVHGAGVLDETAPGATDITINSTICSLGGSCSPQGAATPLQTGTSVTLAAPRNYFVCTSTCTITLPVPAAGDEFCVRNDNNVATIITFNNPGSSVQFEKTTFASYGTATTGTAVSGGATGDKLCLVGRDTTHYLVGSYNGTWTMN
jgi:hypothetical protein